MEVREIELPGIGKKFEMFTGNGDKVVIIIHDDGKREIYQYDQEDQEESISNVYMSDEEARQFSAILGGVVYKPKELVEIEMELGSEFKIKWQKVEAGSKACGKTVLELGIKQDYGIIVIAVIKNDKEKIFNPGPDTKIESGDTLVISGNQKNIKRAIDELLYKGGSS